MGKKQYTTRKTRLPDLLMHTKRYAFEGPSRLAEDCGCSASTINRLIAGRAAPSHNLVSAIARVLEKEFGRHIDPRDIVMDDTEHWLTPNVCELVGCIEDGYGGCYPDYAYDDDDVLRPEFDGVKPGYWSLDPELSREALC